MHVILCALSETSAPSALRSSIRQFGNSAMLATNHCFLLLHPIGLDDLPRASQSQRVRRHIFGDARSRADVRPVTDGDRRHQRRVRADRSEEHTSELQSTSFISY